MKSHDTSLDNDYKSRAAANDRQKETGLEKNDLPTPGQTVRRRPTDVINSSPYMVSQTKRLRGISGQAVQKQGVPEEEELMQGQLTAQRQPEEDEELMQGKIAAQLQGPEEDEELLQGKSAAQMQLDEEEELQGKFAAQRQPLEEEEEPIQGKFTAQRQLEEEEELQGKFTAQMKSDENRTGMPDDLKANMESAFNTDFSDVRVHPDSGKATEVGALAYTQGTDVHFAPGQFKPESSAGQQLLGHELTHVVQQGQGRVKPTGEVAGLPVNDSPDLENEADRMAKKALK